MRTRNFRITLIVFVLFIQAISAMATERHGLYVGRFNEILGHRSEEIKLLRFAENTGTNSLSFYQLDEVDLNLPENRQKLRNFIRLARDEYHINHFGAVSESLKNFRNNIHVYNLDPKTRKSDRINAYNIEFEFWNKVPSKNYYCSRYLAPAGYECSQDGAFRYVLHFIKELRKLADEVPGTEVEIYVGWLEAKQARMITPLVDRIYYAVYRNMEIDGSLSLYHFGMQRQRLKNLGASGSVEIVPIFSGDKGTADPSLYLWLKLGNKPYDAWDHYARAFHNDPFLRNKKNLKLAGYQWFLYNTMPYISGVK